MSNRNVFAEPRFVLALGAAGVAAAVATAAWAARRLLRGTTEDAEARAGLLEDVDVDYEERPDTTWVEIGGQRMTLAQYDAARWPLLHDPPPV